MDEENMSDPYRSSDQQDEIARLKREIDNLTRVRRYAAYLGAAILVLCALGPLLFVAGISIENKRYREEHDAGVMPLCSIDETDHAPGWLCHDGEGLKVFDGKVWRTLKSSWVETGGGLQRTSPPHDRSVVDSKRAE